MVVSEKKAKVSSNLAAPKTDSGSSAFQVTLMTARINELTGHLKANKKDFAARRGLLQLVGKRKRLLKYIADHDSEAYLKLIKELGIRR